MNAHEYMALESRKRHEYYKEAQKAYEACEITLRDLCKIHKDGLLGLKSKFESLVPLMDDQLREDVCFEFAPCSELFFLKVYCERHLEKFGEEFTFPN